MFVAVYFDAVGEQKVRELWEIGHSRGFDQTLHTLGIRPHLTVGAWEAVDIEAMTTRLQRLAAEHRQFELTFDTVGSFAAGQGVVLLLPHASQALMDLHADLYEGMPAPSVGRWAHYSPGLWMPHCTVSIGVADERLGDAFVAIRSQLTPFAVTVKEITLADAFPVDTKALFPLAEK